MAGRGSRYHQHPHFAGGKAEPQPAGEWEGPGLQGSGTSTHPSHPWAESVHLRASASVQRSVCLALTASGSISIFLLLSPRPAVSLSAAAGSVSVLPGLHFLQPLRASPRLCAAHPPPQLCLLLLTVPFSVRLSLLSPPPGSLSFFLFLFFSFPFCLSPSSSPPPPRLCPSPSLSPSISLSHSPLPLFPVCLPLPPRLLSIPLSPSLPSVSLLFSLPFSFPPS